MSLSPLAGLPAPQEILIDVDHLLDCYFSVTPDAGESSQKVAFGTSGHRGTSTDGSFNEAHVLAISQAVCDYRKQHQIFGPLYLGKDTHALSDVAQQTALEVFAANQIQVFFQQDGGFTPTPVISHAILTYNKENKGSIADGVVITPSHNPPQDGGYKYNPPAGGPAGTEITSVIQDRANSIIANGLKDVRRVPLLRAMLMENVHPVDFMPAYLRSLDQVIDFGVIANSQIKIGVDPLGGAAVHYWDLIAEMYQLDLSVVNRQIDPTFSFMSVDHDGKIRMDCSSPYAMAGLIRLKDDFDIAFGNDPDVDRHGIVTPQSGLMNPNHYLAVAIWYLFQNRPQWGAGAKVGKTIVSSSMIDRVSAGIHRQLSEVPVGFKWFVDGLLDGSLGFGGEESAGASFLRLNGDVWTTDKDGIIMDLLGGEMLARLQRSPGELYRQLTDIYGDPVYERVDAPATPRQKAVLKALSPEDVRAQSLAGEKILARITRAPGNQAEIGGLKVITGQGWFAARPSGTEDIYKIYAESFLGTDHLHQIQAEAREIVSDALGDA